MESTNLQQEHHQFQDYLSVPSSLASPCLRSTADNHHAFFLNNSNNIHASCGDHQPSPNTSFNNNNSMIQDQEFSLPNTNINIIQSPFHHDINHNHHLNPNLIKEESSTSSDHSDNNNNNNLNNTNNSSFQSEMLLLNTTLSPTYKNHMLQPSLFQPNMHEFQDNIHNNDLTSSQSKGVTKFSQIFPSVNVSKLTSSSMEVCNSNSNGVHGGLDSFGTTSFSSGGSINQPSAASSNHLLELFKGGSDDHGSLQYDGIRLCKSSNNLSSFDNNGVLESQRRNSSSYIVEPNLSHQTTSKKQRFESRASCPPFKVRKEKLGDRVSALQQLVAPFGKTDTASVLMEAIGYIKFLQSQVETLSVPYMKLASRNGSSNNKQRISNELSDNGDQKQDLRSRGLCLVPLSCMSYITSDPGINGVSWPHPYNFDPGF